LPARDRDHDEGQATWREAAKAGDAIGGHFVNGEFQPDPEPTRTPRRGDEIFDPQPELRRLQNAAFAASGRASAAPPAPKVGSFHRRSLRRFQP
jgi:hypothetical protein